MSALLPPSARPFPAPSAAARLSQPAPPNGNRSSGAFGTITSTYDARQLQLGFKFLW